LRELAKITRAPKSKYVAEILIGSSFSCSEYHAIAARRIRLLREIIALTILVLTFSTLPCSQAHVSVNGAPQGSKIELSLKQQVLRGDILIISGRLSTTIGDLPIPLVRVHLQYYRAEDVSFTREVSIITSNPGGRFEDIFNTTSLLRIGPWYVNASFAGQVGYQPTSTIQHFVIVVQPSLSIYLSSHAVPLGQKVIFNGLLFACIPCIQDEVTVVFSRPDNTSIQMPMRATPIGGPYPGGYYNGTFTPDVAGMWHVRAVWNGNDVTLPAYSQVEELTVEARGAGSGVPGLFYAALAVTVLAIVVLGGMLWRRRSRKRSS
jgi:hypothetical protein